MLAVLIFRFRAMLPFIFTITGIRARGGGFRRLALSILLAVEDYYFFGVGPIFMPSPGMPRYIHVRFRYFKELPQLDDCLSALKLLFWLRLAWLTAVLALTTGCHATTLQAAAAAAMAIRAV